jgi:hypothetical protein
MNFGTTDTPCRLQPLLVVHGRGRWRWRWQQVVSDLTSAATSVAAAAAAVAQQRTGKAAKGRRCTSIRAATAQPCLTLTKAQGTIRRRRLVAGSVWPARSGGPACTGRCQRAARQRPPPVLLNCFPPVAPKYGWPCPARWPRDVGTYSQQPETATALWSTQEEAVVPHSVCLVQLLVSDLAAGS